MRNKHKVPLKQWRRWSLVAQGVFNDTFDAMRPLRPDFFHPTAQVQTVEQWRTTCFNAAWIAAESVMKSKALALISTLAIRLNQAR